MKDKLARAAQWVKENPETVFLTTLSGLAAAQIVFLGHVGYVNHKNMKQLKVNSKNFKEAVDRGIDFIAKPDGSLHIVNPK